MSRLDDVLDRGVVIDFREDSIPSLRGGTLEQVCKDSLKQQIKKLMRETYNKSLQAYVINKTTSSLDEAFDKAVDEL